MSPTRGDQRREVLARFRARRPTARTSPGGAYGRRTRSRSASVDLDRRRPPRHDRDPVGIDAVRHAVVGGDLRRNRDHGRARSRASSKPRVMKATPWGVKCSGRCRKARSWTVTTSAAPPGRRDDTTGGVDDVDRARPGARGPDAETGATTRRAPVCRRGRWTTGTVGAAMGSRLHGGGPRRHRRRPSCRGGRRRRACGRSTSPFRPAPDASTVRRRRPREASRREFVTAATVRGAPRHKYAASDDRVRRPADPHHRRHRVSRTGGADRPANPGRRPTSTHRRAPTSTSPTGPRPTRRSPNVAPDW